MPSGDDCILFEHFVKLLHSISQIQPTRGDTPRNRTKDRRNLGLVNRWFARIKQYYPVIPDCTCKIFFRLFFPEEDVRRRYTLKETILARTLARDVFGLSIGAQGAGRALMEWSEYPDAVDKAKLGCLGVEVEKALGDRYSVRQGTSPSIQRIDMLLDELASLSDYSNLGSLQHRSQRTRAAILRDLYLSLDPVEAKFITQIILKDLRPVLYPITETHTTRALLHYKSNALPVLTKWEVMNAWHACMPRIYRARATLDEAARAVEALPSKQQVPLDNEAFLPVLGIPIEIPKSQKGVKLSHALSYFQDTEEVWSETKYDGERMQIHVDLSRPPSQQITIFSKSKRNSTRDRMGTHPIIRASLGLPACAEDGLQYPTLRKRASDLRATVTSSVILDAEMVSYSESKYDIDEFWRIRSLVESTAHGIRGARSLDNHRAHFPESESQDSRVSDREKSPDFIAESLQSNASDNGDRHLKIVFFDIMFINGCSLLDQGYCERRAQLERTINIIPGFASLSWRQNINLSRGIPVAIVDLARIFSQHVASHQEGLVLKASRSIYNGPTLPWVKLKRDYIPGYGDTVDLVMLGASWNKVRARELRVAPETFTTFFVAALDKPMSGSDLTNCSPQFQILFTVEYGMDREQLETLNLYIKTSEPQAYGKEMLSLPYKFRLPGGFAKPTVMFSQPLLGELFGAGFSKDVGAKYYSLRFPRLTKVWRANERNWAAGSCLEDFQKIARSSIGRESSDEWANRHVEAMWGCDADAAPKDSRRVAKTTRQWYDKLLRLEGFTVDNIATRKAASTITAEPSSKRRKLHSSGVVAPPLKALGSVTNFPEKNSSTQAQRQTDIVAHSPPINFPILSRNQRTLQGEKEDKTIGDMITATRYAHVPPVSPDRTAASQKGIVVGSTSEPKIPSSVPIEAMQLLTPVTSSMAFQSNYLKQSSSSPPSSRVLDPATFTTAISSIESRSPEISKNISDQLSDSYWPQHYIHTPVVQFIQDAYVWIHRDSDNKRPTNRPPALHLVPQNRRIGVIYFLLIICGCSVEVEGEIYLKKPEQFSHVNKCVMFVKTGDQPEVKEGVAWLLEALESWRVELNKPGNKELFVLDSEMITYSSLKTFHGDVTSRALWRSSRRLHN